MAPLDGVCECLGVRSRLLRPRRRSNFLADLVLGLEKASFDYEEFIDAGDSVVTILSQRVRGRASGIELDWESYGQIWTVRNGKIVRVEFVQNRAEALEAAGLSD